MWRVVVCDQETSNEEAKARYGYVKNTTKRVVTPRKQTNKQIFVLYFNTECSYPYCGNTRFRRLLTI